MTSLPSRSGRSDLVLPAVSSNSISSRLILVSPCPGICRTLGRHRPSSSTHTHCMTSLPSRSGSSDLVLPAVSSNSISSRLILVSPCPGICRTLGRHRPSSSTHTHCMTSLPSRSGSSDLVLPAVSSNSISSRLILVSPCPGICRTLGRHRPSSSTHTHCMTSLPSRSGSSDLVLPAVSSNSISSRLILVSPCPGICRTLGRHRPSSSTHTHCMTSLPSRSGSSDLVLPAVSSNSISSRLILVSPCPGICRTLGRHRPSSSTHTHCMTSLPSRSGSSDLVLPAVSSSSISSRLILVSLCPGICKTLGRHRPSSSTHTHCMTSLPSRSGSSDLVLPAVSSSSISSRLILVSLCPGICKTLGRHRPSSSTHTHCMTSLPSRSGSSDLVLPAVSSSSISSRLILVSLCPGICKTLGRHRPSSSTHTHCMTSLPSRSGSSALVLPAVSSRSISSRLILVSLCPGICRTLGRHRPSYMILTPHHPLYDLTTLQIREQCSGTSCSV